VVGVASSGIMFILNFMKIGHVIQKIERGHMQRQHGDLISLLNFHFMEGKQTNKVSIHTKFTIYLT